MAAFSKAYLAGLLAVLTGAAVLAGCGTDSTSSSGGGGGSQTIQIWEGYTAAEAKAFSHLVAEYEAQHPGQKVSPLFVNNDNTLEKVLTAVRGGSPPDIAYLYGSYAANLANAPKVVDVKPLSTESDVNWDDFWPAERQAVTVGDKIIGVFNFSEHDKTAWINVTDGNYTDLMTGRVMTPQAVEVPAYGFYWLKKL
jgi:multiple sugar transport system substrate-binding protein